MPRIQQNPKKITGPVGQIALIENERRANLCKQLHPLVIKGKKYLEELNLFESVPPTTDTFKLRLQRLSTKLFIILLVAIFYNFLLYLSSDTVANSIIVSNPTLNQYFELYKQHEDILMCPCSKISINYETFIKINYSFHQLCHSIFLNDAWLKFIDDSTSNVDDGLFYIVDFRSIGSNIFTALRSLCEMTAQFISDALNQFNSNKYISAMVVPKQFLISQSNKSINEFISSTISSFLLSLKLVREMIQANSLQTAQMSNYYRYYSLELNGAFNLPIFYDDSCSCAKTNLCKTRLPVYRNPTGQLIWYLPGFYAGCFVLEALFQSTLECFYNQPCLNELQTHVQSRSSINVTALNPYSSTKFQPNTTILTIVNELMVDEWNRNINYDQYYATCQPSRCSYVKRSKHDKVYIVTALFSLIGGLITTLKFCIPKVVLFIGMLSRRQWQRRVSAVGGLRQHFYSIPRKLIQRLLELNLFPSIPPTTNILDLRIQRISTRLYVVLLSISLSILLIYTAITPVIETVTIRSPNLTEYEHLYAQYRQSLTCPCTKISTNYQTLMDIDYSFHKVCKSIFIEESWITSIEQFTYDGYIYSIDFRSIGPHMFRALGKYCELVNQTISDSLSQFYANNYVSAIVVPLKTFESQLDGYIDEFISSTTDKFLYSVRLIRDNHQVNAIVSALSTNYFILFDTSSREMYIRIRYMDDGCSCSDSSQCKSKLGFHWNNASSPSWFIPGMYFGCFVSEGLLQSSLECFYNQPCLDEVQSYVRSRLPINATALDSDQSSKFSTTTKIATILNELMVEEWSRNIMHENFYASCQPKQCSYTISVSHNVISIITVLIGLLGGLETVLKLCIPVVVSLLIRHLYRRRISLETSNRGLGDRLKSWSNRIKNYFSNLNLFPSIEPTTNLRDLRIQRISTRVYLLLLIFSLYILILYISGIPVVRTMTISSPTLTDYQRLYKRYPQTLTCACTKINTNYEIFIHVNYSLHQVCQSMYVSQLWIIYLLASRPDIVWEDDFRWTGPKMFQALRDLCELVSQTITDSLSQFYSIEYINGLLVPIDQLEIESITFVDQFISSTTNKFVLLMRLISDISQANNLLSVLWTNFKLEYHLNERTRVYERKYDYDCGCKMSSGCRSGAHIHRNDSYASSTWIVPGFYMGCFILESLRQSHLKCFYNQTCLTELHDHLESRLTMSVPTLNSSNGSSRYDPETAIGDILDQLMVERWTRSFMYDRYFASCHPTECFYTISTRNNIIYIITTVIGLLGGLMKVLQFIVPKVIHLTIKCIDRKRRNVVKNITTEKRNMASTHHLRTAEVLNK